MLSSFLVPFRKQGYTCYMIIPSCSTDHTCKMLYRIKFLDMQVRVPNSSCIFKMGANKWYRYIGRSRNLLHCHKCSKSVSRAEEIISRNLKYILHNHYGYIWSEVSKLIHSHLVYIIVGLIMEQQMLLHYEPHIIALPDYCEQLVKEFHAYCIHITNINMHSSYFSDWLKFP